MREMGYGTRRFLSGAAHHLDLQAPDPRDPPSVPAARAEEERAIRRWAQAWRAEHVVTETEVLV